MQVLDALLSEYEASCHGPGKWQKLAVFLQQRFVSMFYFFFKMVVLSALGFKSLVLDINFLCLS